MFGWGSNSIKIFMPRGAEAFQWENEPVMQPPDVEIKNDEVSSERKKLLKNTPQWFFDTLYPPQTLQEAKGKMSAAWDSLTSLQRRELFPDLFPMPQDYARTWDEINRNREEGTSVFEAIVRDLYGDVTDPLLIDDPES